MSFDAPVPRPVSVIPRSIGVVAARFNSELVDAMLERVSAKLKAAGLKDETIAVVRVPGSHEVPWAAQRLAASGRHDAVIALGILIAGDTNHHEMVGTAVAQGLVRVALDTGVPVINGVIVVNTRAQAEARARGEIDRGAEFAAAALEMAELNRALS
jgi:6,7-dimethyl-8-ribityllumazine synthase